MYINNCCICKNNTLNNIWSAIIRINTEGKSLIMKLGPAVTNTFGNKLNHVIDVYAI